MRLFHLVLALTVVVLACQAALPVQADGPVAVLTRSYDLNRSGANLNEVVLSTANVGVAQFGKLFSRAVDGHIYAQPLYVPDVNVPGKGVHNVVYVATQHDSVYAFDADDPAASAPLWQVSLGTSVPLPSSDVGRPTYADIQVEVGIVGTPVIDPNSGTLYVVALTREPLPAICPCSYMHRLHALDLYTGAEKFGGPVAIGGSALRLAGGQTVQIVFDNKQQLQRPGLLLSQGKVYVAFGSYGDFQPYHGWIFGYDAATLQAVSIFDSTPTGAQGSIWQGGQGLAADVSGSLYVITANGTFDVNLGGSNYGDSLLRLSPVPTAGGVLPVADWFTPFDQAVLSSSDQDMGSAGPVLIPGTSLILAGAKTGELFLVNSGSMGHYNGPGGPDSIVQRFSVANGRLFGSPVYWNSPGGGRLYIWGSNDALKELSFNGASFQTTPVVTGSTSLGGMEPGGILALSANAGTAGSGVLWASHPTADANQQTVPGVLRAYDAANVGVELWTSEQNSARDSVGSFGKFVPPTVADGKVFLATFSGQLQVYGLFTPGVITPPSGGIVAVGQTFPLSVRATGPAPLTYAWYQGASGDTTTPAPAGTNSPTYTTPPITTNTSFWVRVSNGAGSADSRAATIVAVAQVLRTFLPVVMR
jgi:hypothetical protein